VGNGQTKITNKRPPPPKERVVLTASPQNFNSWTETNIPNSHLHLLLFCALISAYLTLTEIHYIVFSAQTFFMHARVILCMVTDMTCNYGISKINLYLLLCSDDILLYQYHILKCNMRPSSALYCVSHGIIILQTSKWAADVEMFLWAML
jgi:hypothetical protein